MVVLLMAFDILLQSATTVLLQFECDGEGEPHADGFAILTGWNEIGQQLADTDGFGV